MKRDIHAALPSAWDYINPESNGLIDKRLTPEIIFSIFMTLRNVDLLSTRQVNRFWMERTVYIAKSHIENITESVLLLNNKLKLKDKDQALSLYELNASIAHLNRGTFNLKKYMGCRWQVKQNLFDVLMHLSIENLTSFRCDFPLFDPIFELAEVYKEIETSTKTTSIRLAKALTEIDDTIPLKIDRISIMPKPLFSIKITRNEIINTLLKVIKKTPSQEQDLLVQEVSISLAHKGLTDEALTIADNIEDDSTRNFTFMLIIASTQDVYQTIKNK